AASERAVRPPPAAHRMARRRAPVSTRTPALGALERLESIARDYGAAPARAKRALLARLARTPMPSAAAVARLHEVATFLLAYADDARVHAAALRVLRGFAARPDVARFATALAD